MDELYIYKGMECYTQFEKGKPSVNHHLYIYKANSKILIYALGRKIHRKTKFYYCHGWLQYPTS